ncbi:hypothetical protein GCM10009753_65070 [Streptantibioticus ferralitis]
MTAARDAQLTRVLLTEDQRMMRGALALLLGREDDMEVVAQVSDGDAIVPAAKEAQPDVALLGGPGAQPRTGARGAAPNGGPGRSG